ncbi:MAG: hypothetical protein LBF26_03000 [Puniceicoccales bacterium]|jgi:hypothetical protein|nr:hypothetical protein [Puniceicoccales bacterium]
MTNSVHADLESIVQNLGITSASSSRVEDRSAFVPNVATMRASAARGQSAQSKPEKDQPCTDANLQRKKIESAQVFAQRIDPSGAPEPYLEFASALTATLLRDSESDDGTRPGADAASDGDEAVATPESEEATGTAPADGEEFGRQKLNADAYPAGVRKTLNQVVQQIQRTTGQEPKTIAEIFNFAQFALTAAEKDRDAYAVQEQRASNRSEQLRRRKDPKGIEKFHKTEKLLTAIRADKKNAETVCDQLSVAVQEMDRLDGGRIRDGFNIIPKAFKIIEERKLDGQPAEISATELSATYCEKILEFTTPSQFYEDYAKNYSHMEFSQFIDLALRLLGDDIKSTDSSRGKSFLVAIRDGLFHAEICYQIFNSVGQIDAQFFRLTRLREVEAGTYVPNYLVIAHSMDGTLKLSTARAEGEATPLCSMRMAPNVDHFGKISELFRDHGIEDFILLPDPGMDRKSVRQFKNGLVIRYGRRVFDHIPKAEMNSTEVADGEPHNAIAE